MRKASFRIGTLCGSAATVTVLLGLLSCKSGPAASARAVPVQPPDAAARLHSARAERDAAEAAVIAELSTILNRPDASHDDEERALALLGGLRFPSSLASLFLSQNIAYLPKQITMVDLRPHPIEPYPCARALAENGMAALPYLSQLLRTTDDATQRRLGVEVLVSLPWCGEGTTAAGADSTAMATAYLASLHRSCSTAEEATRITVSIDLIRLRSELLPERRKR